MRLGKVDCKLNLGEKIYSVKKNLQCEEKFTIISKKLQCEEKMRKKLTRGRKN
jgi:hypothetical protein